MANKHIVAARAEMWPPDINEVWQTGREQQEALHNCIIKARREMTHNTEVLQCGNERASTNANEGSACQQVGSSCGCNRTTSVSKKAHSEDTKDAIKRDDSGAETSYPIALACGSSKEGESRPASPTRQATHEGEAQIEERLEQL